VSEFLSQRSAKITTSNKAIRQILKSKDNSILRKENKKTLRNKKSITLKSTQKTIVKSKKNLLKKKFNLDIAFVLLLSTINFINIKKKIIFETIENEETLIEFKTRKYINRRLINVDNIKNLEFKYILLA